uniref:Uncharacterized protein n=2 Tax=Magallana gigas TaxID=29159 RepID=A0A8W8HM61_MAGGI
MYSILKNFFVHINESLFIAKILYIRLEVFFRPSVQKEKMTGVKFFILLFVLSCLQTMNSEGRSFQDRGNGYTEGPYGEFGPIEASAGDASFRMTWTSAVCVYGTVALVLLIKGW